MKLISHNKHLQLKRVVGILTDKYKMLLMHDDIVTISDLWEMAVHYNKIQNQYLKEDYDPNAVVKTLITATDPCVIRAKKKFSRMQWFIILYMDSHYACIKDMQKAVRIDLSSY